MKAPALILAATLLAPASFAATHAVLPGGSIQAKVDAAAPGDIVAVFGGTYTADVTVNKAIRLVEVDGQDVTITGNVTFTGITNAPPFEGFTVGSSGKGITIANTTGIVLKNIDARPGSGVTVNGTSKVGITGGFYSQIAQDGGELTTTLSQITGSFNTTTNAQKTVALRVSVSGAYNWNARKSWLGYSSGNRFAYAGSNGLIVIVGSRFVVNGASVGISVSGTGNYMQLINSIVRDVVYYSYKPGNYQLYAYGHCVVINGGNSAYIANNYFHGTDATDPSRWDIPFSNSSDDMAVGVYSGNASTTAVNNIFEGIHKGIHMPYGAISRNQFFFNVPRTIRGGVVDSDSISGNPLFVAGQIPAIQSSSPCVNAGLIDPIHNDLNGTRNDIGPSGGCLFDPAGWTTTNPVVISFDLAPQQLLKGVDTSVNLSNGQAVAQP